MQNFYTIRHILRLTTSGVSLSPWGECEGGKTLLRPQDATCIVSVDSWVRISISHSCHSSVMWHPLGWTEFLDVSWIFSPAIFSHAGSMFVVLVVRTSVANRDGALILQTTRHPSKIPPKYMSPMRDIQKANAPSSRGNICSDCFQMRNEQQSANQASWNCVSFPK